MAFVRKQLDTILRKSKGIVLVNTLPNTLGVSKEYCDELIGILIADGLIVPDKIYDAESYRLSAKGYLFKGYRFNYALSIAKDIIIFANAFVLTVCTVLGAIYVVREMLIPCK